jgi:hypothetical protein
LFDLATLLRLRLRLMARVGLRRYTRNAQLAAPFYLGGWLLAGVWFLGLLILPATQILTFLLHNPRDRPFLTAWLAWGASSATVLVFFYAVLSLVAILTYRSDLKVLLLAPASPLVVLGEKLLSTSLVSSSGLLLTVPALIALGRAQHLFVSYYLVMLLVLFLLPLPAVALATFLVLAMVRLLAPGRVRSVTTILGTFIAGGLYMGQQILVLPASRTPSRLNPPLLPDWLPSTWPGRALAAIALGQPGTAMVYLLAEVLLSSVLFMGAVQLASRMFTSGSSSYEEVGRLRRRPALRSVARAMPGAEPSEPRQRPAPAWLILLQKEWLLLRRDTQRMAALVYPLFIIGFFIYRTLSQGAVTHADPTTRFAGILNGSLDWMLTLTIILLLNAMAPSIVNREGRSLYLMTVAPIDAREVLYSKWAICAAPILLLVEGILVAGAIAQQMSFLQAFFTALAMAVLIIALVGLVILINLVWPRLDATSPWKQTTVIASLMDLVAKIAIGGLACILLILAVTLWNSWPLVAVGAALAFCVVTGLITAVSSVFGRRLLGNLLSANGVAP